MDSLTDDVWTMVLARLPIRIFTCFKLVCKQWKTIVESPAFRNLFMSLHQNSPSSSSWSLMSTCHSDPKMVDYYQCDTWGLKRPLGSYIKPILNEKNPNHKYRQVSVVAYSDVGLILIYAMSREKPALFVANPVSYECIEIFLHPRPKGFERRQLCYWQWGIATRIENDILLSYKVVVFNQIWGDTMLSCLIYSSETGMWSLDDTSFSSYYYYSPDPISLNGKLHWIAKNDDNQQVVLSMDLYTNNSTGSDRCRVSPFPDLEKTTKYRRACTPCHGFLMYINIVDGDKLCVWRLESEGWQLISQISPGSILTDYARMTINPFDATTAYFWSEEQESLLYINLHNGKSVIYNQFELTSDGRTMIPAHDPRAVIFLKNKYLNQEFLVPFVLPQWLYRIPNTVRRV